MSSSRQPPLTAPRPGTYTAIEGIALASTASTRGNTELVAAADYMVRVFEANAIPFALMGGFSLLLRGSPRATHDVDFAVGCDMHQLQTVLSRQSHILRPAGPVAGVVRIFVNINQDTRPEAPKLNVVVDILLRGSLGAPDEPATASEMVTVNQNGGQKTYRVANLPTMVSAKLGAAFARSTPNDIEDLIFMVNAYPNEIYSFRAQLNQLHRQEFINALMRLGQSVGGQNVVRKAKMVLGIV